MVEPSFCDAHEGEILFTGVPMGDRHRSLEDLLRHSSVPVRCFLCLETTLEINTSFPGLQASTRLGRTTVRLVSIATQDPGLYLCPSVALTAAEQEPCMSISIGEGEEGEALPTCLPPSLPFSACERESRDRGTPPS